VQQAATTLRAAIFDTDGVVTRTTAAHFGAWKRLFDEFLTEQWSGGETETGTDFSPFTEEDYRRYVDGMPRYDGVAHFLESRGISLPWGTPDGGADRTTVCGLGNRKNGYFLNELHSRGVEAFASTVRFIESLQAHGIRTAVISASENCAEVLRAAGVDGLFDVRVDGIDAHNLDLAGKPDPAVFLEAARRLGVEPGEAAIVEDAIAGVEAGAAGGFRMVIGVDRTSHPEPLARYADIVVPDLSDLAVDDDGIHRVDRPSAFVTELSSALKDGDVMRRLDGRSPAVFLDYDGTLTPIVERPEQALLPDATREALERLSALCAVGIISGRDLGDLRSMVECDRIWLAGSHGWDIRSPNGERRDFERDPPVTPALARAEELLAPGVASITGAWVERKRFAISIHFRQTPEKQISDLGKFVVSVADECDGLRVVGGKKIFELRPDIDWDKGTALRWMLQAASGDDGAVLPVYIGDDVTDEDAFLAIRGDGLGVVVGNDCRPSAAHHRLSDPDEVRAFLDRLADLLEDSAS
jgi:alpha,alpha-trehalase